MDSNIMCGLVLRSGVLQRTISGEARHKTLWKHILTGLIDRLVFWSARVWLWKVLGISLLLPHKDDILKRRSVYISERSEPTYSSELHVYYTG